LRTLNFLAIDASGLRTLEHPCITMVTAAAGRNVRFRLSA